MIAITVKHVACVDEAAWNAGRSNENTWREIQDLLASLASGDRVLVDRAETEANHEYLELRSASQPPSCQKRAHGDGAYLHAADDDSPYDVDGILYCGRCHFICDETGYCLSSFAKAPDAPQSTGDTKP